jgi:hypothetical protein
LVRSNWFSGRGVDSRTLRIEVRLPFLRSIRGKNKDEPIDSLHDIMRLENTMHNRNVLARDPIHCDVTRLVAFVCRVDEEEQVSTIERRFHGAAE